MIRLLMLAVRNLFRNKRRSAITAAAVVAGATAIVFLQGFVNGFITMAVGGSVLSKNGAVQIHKKGYMEADDPLKVNMPLDEAFIHKLESIPGVTGVAPRIVFDGMVSNGTESTMFMATAIDPVREYKVCPKRADNVAAGSQPIRAGHDNEVLLGKGLAEAMGVKQGGTVVLQSAGPNAGGTNALDVDVSGFLPSRFITESKRMSTVSLALAQDLLRMKGQVTEYAISVEDFQNVDPTRDRIKAAVGDGYDVNSWREIDTAVRDFEHRMKYVLGFIGVVLFLLVGTGIINTMLMSVYERVREIGTMLAVGVRRYQITAMFLFEAMALGILGAFAGAGIGVLLVRRLGHRGILMHPPGGDPQWMYPHIESGYVLAVVAFAAVGTMLAALYPAWKASRLRPVEALRAN